MGCSNDDSFPSAIFKQRKHFSREHRPRMLKDFLVDDSNSCSSTGFKSFPRKPTDSSSSLPIRSLIEKDLDKKHSLIRGRSRSSLSTISAFQAMINAVKNIQFTALRSSSILPRSLSRRLSKNNAYERGQPTKELTDIKVTVTIKDIIRWRSFRDMIEENSTPLDFPSSSPQHYAATTTTTTTTTVSASTTPCSRSSNGSSWCDSDFTAEYLPCWDGNSGRCKDKQEAKVGKICLPRVGEDSLEAETIHKVERMRQQNSPVSIIDNIEFEQDDDDDHDSSSFERKRQKLMHSIQRLESLSRSLDPFNLEKWISMDENNSCGEDNDCMEEGETETNNSDEEVEDKAWKLLNHVKETSLQLGDDEERMALDFFRDELRRKRCESINDAFDSEMLRRVKAWMDGEYIRWSGWERKEAYVNGMEKEGKWVESCEEEQQELVLGIENGILSVLVDELLVDLTSSSID